jgi:hypothetical protein
MTNGANEASGPPHGIFISYRRDDVSLASAMLAMSLERLLPGTSVFRDRESIGLGRDWKSTLGAQIEASAIVLVLIGPKWLTLKDEHGGRRLDAREDPVAWEIGQALASDIRRVIPVLLEGAQPPAAGDLPQAISKLATLQAQKLTDDEDIRERIAAFARRLGQEQLAVVRAWRRRELLPAVTPVVSEERSIADIVADIKRTRDGGDGYLPDPANAMAALRDFAQLRPVDDLLGLWPAGDPGGFDRLDVVAILTLAAVDRDPREAARLAVELRRAAGGPSDLTRSIIHDLAAQRTVPDVAEFIAECERLGQQDPALETMAKDLMLETVATFVGSESRVSLDKALLHFELKRVHCPDMADKLLEETLNREGTLPAVAAAVAGSQEEQQRPLAGVTDEVGIVGALRHLSPQQKIVENWIDERMATAKLWDDMARLVARLLRNETGGDELLARHVARRWPDTPLVRLCTLLTETEGDTSANLRLVWRFLAEREHEERSPAVNLAGVIGGYYTSKSAPLTRTFPEMLTAIVTAPENPEGPCSIDFLENMVAALDSPTVPEQCRLMLLVTAATHPERRPGAEVAKLLIWVGNELRRPRQQASGWPARCWRRAARQVNEWFGFDRDLWEKAQVVNKWYADAFAKESFEPGDYISYLAALREQPTLTFWAVRELTDPVAPAQAELTGQTGQAAPAVPGPSRLSGERIGDLAVRIYDTGRRPDTAFDLLERYLENEQAVTWQAVMDIVGQVEEAESLRSVGMRKHPDWRDLFGATIGRWADTGHLMEVYGKLNHEEEDEREERHRGRDYTKEAAAIMSLSQ